MNSKTPIVPDSIKWHLDLFKFSPGIKAGNTLYLAGAVGVDVDKTMAEDLEKQIEVAFKNIGIVLHEAGADFSNIVDMTTFHVGLQRQMETFMKVKEKFLGDAAPCWTAVGVQELGAPGLLVEIKAVAVLDAD
jgi:enamine deaminase RidA (YjgF/YER057c/UK114 family)